MVLTEKDVWDILEQGRIRNMPEKTFIKGITQPDGQSFPIDVLDTGWAGCRFHLETELGEALGGIEVWLVIDKGNWEE